MANPLIQNTKIFLGINGEQSGPLTESEIVDRIRAGSVPADALIWFEGLEEWQSVQTIPAFSGAFSSGAPSSESAPALPTAAVAPPAAAPGGFKPLGDVSTSVAPTPYRSATTASQPSAETSTFAQGAAEPVFKVEQSLGSAFRPGKGLIAVIVLALGVVGGGGYYYISSVDRSSEVKMKTRAKVEAPPTRQAELAKAQSELLLTPGTSLDILKKIIQDNPTDDVAKQAATAAIDYYRVHSPPDAGRVAMMAKDPEGAVKYFLTEPPLYVEAEKALSEAIKVSQDPIKKRKMLLQDIDLLLGPLNQRANAVEKIRVLEQSFPGEPNPFSYYLKSTDEKIRDIFNRISFSFVKSLIGVFESELPQINFVSRPLIELRKGHDNHYRIVGVYKGEIVLNHDHLNDITFQFWLEKERWILVETNLTSERQKWALGEKEHLKNTALTPEEMLADLEQIFRTQFPQMGLHESVNKPKAPPTE